MKQAICGENITWLDIFLIFVENNCRIKNFYYLCKLKDCADCGCV